MIRLCAGLPVAVLVMQVLFVRRRAPSSDWRRAILGGALLWGVSVAAITELASACHAIAPVWLATSWVLVGIGFFVATIRSPRGGSGLAGPTTGPHEPIALAAIAGTLLVVIGTGLAASFGWPNQWDAMVYHLSRVAHWSQQGSVAFHATHVPRELFNPPWSEYAILHLTALGMDVRAGNLVQWASLLGCLVGVSSVTRHLGGSRAMQWSSVLIAATIPMGVLQAATTQNDLVTAFWLICAVDGVLAASSPSRAVWVGAALGLAFLTKGTALILGPPLVACAWPLRGERLAPTVRAGTLIVMLAIAISGAHYGRNLAAYGNPFGPPDLGSPIGTGDALVNERLRPTLVASNVLRNAALHLGAPWEPWNRRVERLVVGAHQLVGADPFDHASTRAYPEMRYEVRGPLGDPDRTGNPWHLLLVVVSIVAMATSRDSPAAGARRRLAFAVVVAALAFCVVLKWQPWHSRLQLPIFVVGSALVGLALPRTGRLVPALLAVSFLVAVPPLLRNRLAPLVGGRNVFNTSPVDQTFQAFGGPPVPWRDATLGALEVVGARGCSNVGLVIGWDDWEHPFWAFFPGDATARRIEHVLVAGVPDGDFRPCAIIATVPQASERVTVGGTAYERVWEAEIGMSRRLFVLAEAPQTASLAHPRVGR
ncbi:MAG: glycosyltransferase family 39 protein [Candidatus Binatia bacterium]